jgi:hypothetical protein
MIEQDRSTARILRKQNPVQRSRSFVKPGRVLFDVPVYRDRPELRRLGRRLQAAVEPVLSEAAHGWRRGHSVETAVTRIHGLGLRVAALDVVSFFTSIRHRRLRRLVLQLPEGRDLWSLVEPWLPDLGLPEGSPISPRLANLYLTTVDRRWPDSLTRYGDNIVLNVFEPERELHRLVGRLNDLGLATHQHEIDLVHFCGYVLRSVARATGRCEVEVTRPAANGKGVAPVTCNIGGLATPVGTAVKPMERDAEGCRSQGACSVSACTCSTSYYPIYLATP